MRLFVQRFEGEPHKWFKSLAPNTINTMDRLIKLFTQQYNVKKSNQHWLTKFSALKLKHD